MPATAPKSQYKGRPKDCVPRSINLDTRTDRMLMELSGGRYSACLRALIAQEYGRQLALGELGTSSASAEDAHA
jgi:hypothetical protein